MARTMKIVAAPAAGAATLTVGVDPLAVARGHRVMPRGAVHGTAKRPKRARSKQQWRRQLARDGATAAATPPWAARLIGKTLALQAGHRGSTPRRVH
jgi:hypothetical protein